MMLGCQVDKKELKIKDLEFTLGGVWDMGKCEG